MRISMLSLLALSVGMFSLLAWRTGGADVPVASGLPGARPAIDAAQYPSLQAALDALGAEGGTVHLPAGTFEIQQPLVLETEDIQIIGAGTATHIRNVNTEGQSALVIRPKGFDPAVPTAQQRKERLWRVQLSNFRVTGNEKSGHGIEAILVNEILINGVTTSYHGGDGIRLDHCYEDPRVCNSLLTYNKNTGLKIIGCHDIVVAANQFEENMDALQCLDGFNLCMTGNNVDDHLGNGVVIENTYGSVVSGNMIEECKKAAIVLDRDCYGIALSANVIAHEFEGGIELRDAHGCTVSANSFPLVWHRAVYIGPQSGRITVTGNNFSDSYIGKDATRRPPTENQPGGIVLEGTTDVNISGNSLSGLSTKALVLEGATSRRVLFAGNVVTDIESDHDKLVDSHVANNLTAPTAAGQ